MYAVRVAIYSNVHTTSGLGFAIGRGSRSQVCVKP